MNGAWTAPENIREMRNLADRCGDESVVAVCNLALKGDTGAMRTFHHEFNEMMLVRFRQALSV